MTRPRRRGRRGAPAALLPALLAVAPTLLLAVLVPAAPASAHTLDEYRQSTYLTVSPGQVEVRISTAVGVLVAPAVRSRLDADGDATVTDAEARAYAEDVLADVTVTVDGTARTPALDSVDVPTLAALDAGYGVLTVHAVVPAPTSSGRHDLLYRNGFAPEGVTRTTYQVTVVTSPGSTIGTQRRDDAQQQESVDYTLVVPSTMSSPAPAATGEQPSPTASTSGAAGRLLGYLTSPRTGVWVLLVAVGLAALLGALHALTPGHGKTLMAAYLVGSGGTVRDALTLASVVTFTHTASVVAIGVLALAAGRFLVPDLLVPALGLLSGALVVGLGVRLLVLRVRDVRAGRTPGHAHDHSHGHDDAHGHAHGHGHGHDHDHVPALPDGRVSARGLVLLGVSGGLVPCPEALGVLLTAVGLGRTAFGLLVVVAFSLGLSAVLVTLGLLLVRSRSFAARSERLRDGAGRWVAVLPLVGAAAVVVLGAGLVVRAGATLV